MPKTGKTTGNLKMRSGPGMGFEPPIAYLVPDTQLEILDEQGDWLHVRAAGKEGYVGRKWVAITEAPNVASAGDVKQAGELGHHAVNLGGLHHSGEIKHSGETKAGGLGSAGDLKPGAKAPPDMAERKGLEKK